MKHIKYNDKWFNYYSSAKYPGKSILTGKNINVGDSIYWCVGTGGFLAEESKLINNIEVNIVQHHFGPADPKTTTYNDSNSREITCKLFKREFDIDLKNHTGLYIKDNNNEFIEFNNGQYCEDLIGFNNDKIILVEVERSKIDKMFDPNNNDNINILASKYWKYFHDGNLQHEHYMCFINEKLNKACVIPGKNILNKIGNINIIMVDGKPKDFYEIPKCYAKIYDVNESVEDILKSCEVTYP